MHKVHAVYVCRREGTDGSVSVNCERGQTMEHKQRLSMTRAMVSHGAYFINIRYFNYLSSSTSELRDL